MKKTTSKISDLQRAKEKAQAGWDAMREAKAAGAPVKDCIAIVRSASADWNRLTDSRALNII